MSEVKIPQDVVVLLQEHIHTYEELEIIILLHRQPGQEVSGEAIAEALKIPVESVSVALRHLADGGLLEPIELAGSQLRYRGPPDQFKLAVGRLARAYEDRRLEVMGLMTSNAIARLRTSAMRAFADAFLIGKKRDDGSVAYLLCAVTSVVCALMLFKGYRGNRTKLLFWSSLCFAGLALNNILMFEFGHRTRCRSLAVAKRYSAGRDGFAALRTDLGREVNWRRYADVHARWIDHRELTAALLFLRFWRLTGERLFLFFSLGFCAFRS